MDVKVDIIRDKKENPYVEVWKRLKKNKVSTLALAVLILIFTTAICADFIVDYESIAIKQDIANRLKAPSLEHMFGTDGFGRDILARVIHGSRISISIGLFSVFLGFVGGIAFGAPAGYYGGKIDMVLMRVTDVFLAIPSLLLAIAIVSVLGPGIVNVMIAMAISNIPSYARLIRASIMTTKGMEYVESAKIVGATDIRIIMRHIFPNIMGPIIVQCTLGIASTIMSAAALSFMGLGVMPPAPEWGSMLSEGREVIRYHPHVTVFPGLAIVVTVLSMNLLGDGLRDALDPRLKGNV